MLRLLNYLLSKGIATSPGISSPLDQIARGLPYVTQSPCLGEECNSCAEACPTDAITIKDGVPRANVTLDLGKCIACGLCTDVCTTDTLVENLSTQVARKNREDLILSNVEKPPTEAKGPAKAVPPFMTKSLHARVVSTGCSACDLEVGASSNPVFDLDRLGVHVVASPRHADALLVTGPVAIGMQNAVVRCYEAMPDPRIVVAVGTCAISGGVHSGGYASGDGLDKILPVDVYIPGCPPHPWSMLHGVMTARGNAPMDKLFVEKKRTKAAESNPK